MSTLEIILWVLAFALVTMIIYGWGLLESSRQQDDLLAMLYRKGEAAIRRTLKKKGPMTRAQLEEKLSGIHASLFYTKNRAVVRDVHTFAGQLLESMMQRGELLLDNGAYRLNPDRKKR